MKLVFMDRNSPSSDLERLGVPMEYQQLRSLDEVLENCVLRELDAREVRGKSEFFRELNILIAIVGFAKFSWGGDSSPYLVFCSSDPQDSLGVRFFIPLQHDDFERVVRTLPDNAPIDLRIFLALFRRSVFSVDFEWRPFYHYGVPADQYVDFTHEKSAPYASRWKDAVVILMSTNGDALLLNRNGHTVAWFQLETHEIKHASEWHRALLKWVRLTIRGEVYCSWHDEVKATENKE